MSTNYDAIYGDIVFGNDANIDAIASAIAAGHDINCTANSDQWNCLHYVLNPIRESPNAEVVSSLLEQGCSVSAEDRRKWTPLHFAARTGCVATIRLLLVAGADPNVPDDQDVTPFHRYFLQGEIEPSIVELFLEHGGIPTEGLINFPTNCDYPTKQAVLALLQA